jgi:hypothetical protein
VHEFGVRQCFVAEFYPDFVVSSQLHVIPEIPRKVKVKLEHDEKVLKAAREAQKEETTK